jgi:hypothetical protein
MLTSMFTLVLMILGALALIGYFVPGKKTLA